MKSVLKAAYYSGGFPTNNGYLLLQYRCSGAHCSSYFDNSANSWNGITTKVKIVKNNTLKSDGWSIAPVELFENTTSNSGLYGRTYLYKSCSLSGCVSASTTETWARVSAYVYRNVATTIDFKKETATHEFGHVLSLNHN